MRPGVAYGADIGACSPGPETVAQTPANALGSGNSAIGCCAAGSGKYLRNLKKFVLGLLVTALPSGSRLPGTFVAFWEPAGVYSSQSPRDMPITSAMQHQINSVRFERTRSQAAAADPSDGKAGQAGASKGWDPYEVWRTRIRQQAGNATPRARQPD